MTAPEPPISLPESEVVLYPILFKVEDHSALAMGLGSTKVLGGSMVSNPDTALVHQIKAHALSQLTGGESRLDDIYNSCASQVLKTGRTIYEQLDQRLLQAQAATIGAERPFNVMNCTSMEKVRSHLSSFRSATSGGLPSQEEITQRHLNGSVTADEVEPDPAQLFRETQLPTGHCRGAGRLHLRSAVYFREFWA